ncbi:MAG: hypothetical protein BGO70_02750 [Bacteroidetes bacterium 43-93]|nr:hypothetical protein [Bacteroidota bacterium]OJX00705.1 MAG: hypothetical protein BGO70_02750 [Bacteroidetes bacterium 43-93]
MTVENRKNRVITFGLIITVLSIWGYIAHKVIADTKGSNFQIKNNVPVTRKFVGNSGVLDTYSIWYYSRDPFLSIIKDTASVVEKLEQVNVVKPPVLINMPEYFGLITSNRQNTAFVRYKGKYIFLKERDAYDDIRLMSMCDSQVVFSISGNRITVPISTKH